MARHDPRVPELPAGAGPRRRSEPQQARRLHRDAPLNSNPFDAERLAGAYARDRPPVHPLVVDLVAEALAAAPAGVAVDVGCGAGASLAALSAARPLVVGIDPSPAMTRRVTGAPVVVGAFEHLPFADGSVAVVGAAGSLDFADVDGACAEAARILVPAGVALVYDFGLGTPVGLDGWKERFEERFPGGAAAPPQTFDRLRAQAHLELSSSRTFAVRLELPLTRFVDYLCSETVVAAAIEAAGPEEVRRRCEDLLGGVPDPTMVEFGGYLVLLRRPSGLLRSSSFAAPPKELR